MSETDLMKRRAGLSEAKRALLEKRLKGQNAAPFDNQAIPRQHASEHAPLSFAQQRLWFLHQLEPGSIAYNMPVALRLKGQLKTDALERSINEIIRRHQSLRTTFKILNGQPVQAFAARLTLDIPLVDLHEFPEQKREALALRLSTEEAQRPFDLETGPLVRARLLKLNAAEHVLIFTMHHIISDGWSMGVLVHEVAALYKSYVEGEPSTLEELPVQYADFAAWQREWMSGEKLDQQLLYWIKQLKDAPQLLELPTDRPRPARQSFRGAVRPFALSSELSMALKRLAQQEGATLFMILLAAFQSLLHRYTNQREILVGTGIANRNRAELEKLIGFFVNTLVLRADFDGDPTFRQLLSRTRRLTLEAYAHQDLPFERIVEELQPARDLSRNPVFQVSFALQNAPMEELLLPGLTFSAQEFETLTTRFDLEFHLWDLPLGLRGYLFYSTDLFDESTIERLLAHYRRFLEAIVEDPDEQISLVQFLTQAERRRLLIEWNDTRQAWPEQTCVHQLFEQQAAMTPDALAVSFLDQELTYAELNSRANKLAHYLRKLGVGPEALVCICAERSLEMLTAAVAVLKAGGGYVPLDPAYPAQRLAFMLKDARAPVLLTQEHLAARLPESEARVVRLDADWDLIEQESAENPQHVVLPANIAYVIYTSGSTGTPKGTAIEHASLLNLVQWHQRVYEVKASDRAAQIAGLAFDASVWDLWAYLAIGASVHVADEETRLLPEKLLAWMARNSITLSFLPTPLAEAVLDEQCPAGLSLKTLLAGGDRLRRAPREGWPFRLVNIYGPTETTVVATSAFVDAKDAASDVPPPIGRPVDNAQVYILDAGLQLAATGVAGELFIGGAGLARGYIDRPALTAERFIPHPFSVEPGARLYMTGDRVRYLPDGQIEFLGRLDEQVKVRGYRIELGEIEAALIEHDEVRETIVIAREDAPGEKRLVAYVVPRAEEANNPLRGTLMRQLIPSLRRALEERLPDYMIPSSFVLLDALPLTRNGKIDRRALPAPDDARPSAGDDFLEPRTPIEELLTRIWAEVLRVERVGVGDDFFALGGHSLLVTRMVSRVRESFGVELPVRTLFEAPTIRELAGHIEAALRDQTGALTPPIVAVAREGNLPLSFAQQRLWFLHELEPTSSFYNVPVAVRLKGHLERHAIERTLHEIVRRHEALRTSFPTVDGQPVQFISQAFELRLPLIDLSTLPEDEREREAQRLATEEARQPFDLATGPLMRATLVRLSAEDHMLLVTMHHIVSDGWSMGVLVHEVAALYKSYAEGEPSTLEELPVQYADFAVWQRRWLAGEVFETHLRYWKQQLGGELPVLNLPTDKPRPEVQSFHGASRSLQLPLKIVEALNALCKREGVTLFMLLLAAFKVLLHRYTEQSDIAIGSPIANRNRVELEGLIGFFVNTLVMRTVLSGNPTFRELVKRVRAVALEAYAHQDMPFEQLVEQLQPERTMSRNPLFQVMFQMENTPKEELPLPGLRLSPVEVGRVTTQFDLSFDVMENEAGLIAVAEYSTDLFNDATIGAMLRRWQILLEGIIAHPDARISELPLLADAESERLLGGWNETRKEWPQQRLVQELFEAQVEAAPDAVAVVSLAERLTYAELNRQANRVAHFLRARGVGPESLVAMLMEPSAQMIVALLGILKAGGAYLPLDSAYPLERQAFMLEDARASVLLTEERLAARLPETQAQVIIMDTCGGTIEHESEANPACVGTAENLAYVIYTSGSTGRPKGVAVSHQSLVNHSQAVSAAYELNAGDRVLQFASISFDVAAEEILPALLSGASISLPGERVMDNAELLRLIEHERLSVLNLPAQFWREMLRDLLASGRRLPECLRLVVTGSEKVSLEAYAEWLKLKSGVRLINAYGTSETTITSTLYEPASNALEETAGTSLPIGWPIANTRVYILDQYLQPVPPGVHGELYLGGTGLARGYAQRPALTAERFIPDPFNTEPGARLYRTGDRARFLSKGQIEFQGRVDEQVKVRGYRIEPGEIEAALRRHPAVREALALAREEAGGDRRLVAYVRQNQEARGEMAASLETKLEEEQLEQWRLVHDDEVFNQNATLPDPTFNVSGWNSSYTGQPIPLEEMREWVDDAAERILSQRPQRILEIGCGTGLLLFRIAPHCRSYVGTDFSPAALRYVQQQLTAHRERYGEVLLLERRADDYRDVEANSCDAVILNSVVQYFPNVDYLWRVLEGAVRAVERGGFVFVGDVRSLPLLEAFHASVELQKADDSLSLEQLQRLIRKRAMDEEELVIDPAFFIALKERLPQVSHVEVLPKRSRFLNEMTRFRYQVVIHVGPQPARVAGAEWLDWRTERMSLEAIRRVLEINGPETLALRNVVNARTHGPLETIRMLERLNAMSGDEPGRIQGVGGLKEMLRSMKMDGLDPQDLWTLGEELSYQVHISCASETAANGDLDVLFKRRRASEAREERACVVAFPQETIGRKGLSDYANNPLQGKFARYLVPQLRSSLSEQLPDYMIPSSFVLLDEWPLTPGGKIDVHALPAPDSARPQGQGAFVAPRTPAEKMLAAIWSDLLGVARVGIQDNFFELGGHSLLATQLISRVREKLQVEIALRQLFEQPTVAGFAAAIEAAQRGGAELKTHSIVPVGRQAIKRSSLRRAPK
jgi:amino acid adenylation domain-containing protein